MLDTRQPGSHSEGMDHSGTIPRAVLGCIGCSSIKLIDSLFNPFSWFLLRVLICWYLLIIDILLSLRYQKLASLIKTLDTASRKEFQCLRLIGLPCVTGCFQSIFRISPFWGSKI